VARHEPAVVDRPKERHRPAAAGDARTPPPRAEDVLRELAFVFHAVRAVRNALDEGRRQTRPTA
jgi:hypothetical protein